DGARRVGEDHLRSIRDYVQRLANRFLLRGARSHPIEPPGSGPGKPVSFGDLLRQRGPEADRAGHYRSTEQSESLLGSGCDPGCSAQGFLPRRGLPPELPRAPSRLPVYRSQRLAQTATASRAVPRTLQAVAATLSARA